MNYVLPDDPEREAALRMMMRAIDRAHDRPQRSARDVKDGMHRTPGVYPSHRNHSAHAKIVHVCRCGKTILGNAFWYHIKKCPEAK